MRLLHDPRKISAFFDGPNLVSRAGLVPVMGLAERAGLHALVRRHVRIGAKTGVNAEVKTGCLVAGMAAGADSIDDMDVLRHGAMPDLFDGLRAPSTLGSLLRSFSWGNVRQLEEVSRQLLAELARRAPLLPGADRLAFAGIDSTQRRVYGHKKQGAAFGHTKIQGKTVLVRGLNALAGTICTPLAAPVIAATRLRGGSANTARGAASFAAEVLSTARAAGCTGIVVAWMDSGYGAAVCHTVSRAGAYFSVTARLDPAVRAAIASIPADAWTPIKYPHAVFDEQLRRWVSDAEVAQTGYTAFTSRKGQAITARLIVRRVKDLSPKAAAGQGELFTAWRYHAVFANELFSLRFVTDATNAIIMGPVGVGKTFLAAALGHATVRIRHTVHFERAGPLLKRLKASRLDNSHDEQIRRLLRTGLLILDLSGGLSVPSATSASVT